MKADPSDLAHLLEVQELDTAIEQVKHKAKTLPVHQDITDAMARRTQAADNLVASQTALSDAEARAEKAEADVVPVRERLARNQARVDGGAMDPKALSSAIEEIGHLKQRVSDLEDAELEAMEAMEMASAQVGTASAAVESVEKELRQLVEARDAEVAGLAEQARGLGQVRAEKVAGLPEALIGVYDKLRPRLNGVAVSRFDGRRCEGCGLEATVADRDRYLAAAPDEIIRCAECDRILVR